MKVGILSDTHDARGPAEEALSLFLAEGAGGILHLGDVCRPELLAPFRACGLPLIGVFGNGDADREGLSRASGEAFRPGPRMPVVGGRRILMAHTFRELEAEIGEGGRFDLILFGHTHRPLTMRVGRALVLNPGEGCGLSGGTATCAVVDLASMEARILPIGPGIAGKAAGAAPGGE